MKTGDDDPDLSEKELKEIGLLLLRHAMATSSQSLAAAIVNRFLSPGSAVIKPNCLDHDAHQLNRFPDILSEAAPLFHNKDSLILLFYAGMVID